MTSVPDTLRTVCNLVGQLPGVTVQSSEIRKDSARLVIHASGADAIHAVQFIALSANVGVVPWLREPEPSTNIEQTLDAKFLMRDGLKFGELQILGIHCVWRLHKIGLLSDTDANHLLHKWGAAQVGA